MHDDILAAIRPREEPVTVGGLKLVVREMAHAADVASFDDNADLTYKLVVRCVFDEAGAPVFTDDDIPALKAAAKVRLAELVAAVTRVNGFDLAGNAKNSGAAQD